MADRQSQITAIPALNNHNFVQECEALKVSIGSKALFKDTSVFSCLLLPRNTGFTIPQYKFLHFARRGFRQVLDEAHPLWCLEVG